VNILGKRKYLPCNRFCGAPRDKIAWRGVLGRGRRTPQIADSAGFTGGKDVHSSGTLSRPLLRMMPGEGDQRALSPALSRRARGTMRNKGTCATPTTCEGSYETVKTADAKPLPAWTYGDSIDAQQRPENCEALRVAHLPAPAGLALGLVSRPVVPAANAMLESARANPLPARLCDRRAEPRAGKKSVENRAKPCQTVTRQKSEAGCPTRTKKDPKDTKTRGHGWNK
jgi:hypothetical protein